MEIKYIPHSFGDEVIRKLANRRGWITAGVASSVPWPSFDVCVQYAGDEYFLRGSERADQPSPPGITIASDDSNSDDAIAKIYRFTSILSWFLGGYVDVSGHTWSTHPVLYGNPRLVYSSLGIGGAKSFSCNYMPIIQDENVRKALAFWREGKRLESVHPSYAFLSFHKVVESQFSDGRKKGKWITASLDRLKGGAAERVRSLRSGGVDVGIHLFESGRCAVAHASLEGEIVDPDLPGDKRRLAADLVVMKELARLYISEELRVPDDRELYRTRNRLAPWDFLFPESTLVSLRKGEVPPDVDAIRGLRIAVGLWPDGVIPGLDQMRMTAHAIGPGLIQVHVDNERGSIQLVFLLDYPNGRVHTDLDAGALRQAESVRVTEDEVRAYATFFYNVLGNRIAELTLDGVAPVDCEVVIPLNIIPPDPAKAVSAAVERFRADNSNE